MKIVPGKPSYRYGWITSDDTGESSRGIAQWQGQGENRALRPVLPWIPKVTRYITSKDSKGKILEARYTLVIGGHEDTIDADELLQAEAWKRWPGAVGVHDRPLREVLAIIVQAEASQLAQTPAVPYWDGDQLVMPGADLLARGYGERYDSGEVGELLAIATANPKLALLLGFSYGAPYVEPLARQPFWACPSGDSSKGKTTALLAATSLHGKPGKSGANRSWNATVNGVNILLGQLAVMPAFLDEIHMAGFTPATLKKAVHTTCDGADRFTSSRTRKMKDSPPWYGVLFSTGNLSVTGMCPQPEIAVRVVEVPAPIVANSATSKRVKEIARRNYGWWRPIPLAEMSQAIAIAEGLIGMPEDGGAAERIVENLALGVAGAFALGGKPMADAALGAARELLAVQVDELTDEGAKPCEKLVEELRQALIARPFKFPAPSEYDGWLTAEKAPHGLAIEGFHEDGTVRVLTKFMDSIARDAGLDNARIALRELKEAGALRVGVEKDGDGRARLRKRIRLGGKRFDVYEIDLTYDENAKNTGTTGTTGTNTVVSAGQSVDFGWSQPVPVPDPVPVVTGTTPDAGTTAYTQVPLTDEPGTSENAPVPVVPAGPGPAGPSNPGPSNGVASLGDARRAAQRAELAEQLANFRRVIVRSDRFPDADEAALVAGLRTFSAALDGLSFAGAPARVGQLLFEKLSAQYGSVPVLGAPPNQPVESHRVVTMFNMLDQSADPAAHEYVVGLDVNAQFLAAAGTADLGTGDPEPVGPLGDDWREALKLPGYVQLAEDVAVGPGCVLRAGEVIANPMALYLMQRDGVLPVTGGYRWPERRRWLALWATWVRRARGDLMERSDVPSAMALVALKAVYAAFLGGWMNSGQDRGGYNSTNTLRPDWMHMVHSVARANALRALDKATVRPFATLADAAYFLTNDVMDPRGLTLSTQPGKWKLHRLGRPSESVAIEVQRQPRVTTLAEQIERGSIGNVSKVVKALDDQHRGRVSA